MFINAGTIQKFIGSPNLNNELPNGIYNYVYQPFNNINEFRQIKFNSDAIVDIPTKSYLETLNEFKKFKDPKTKELYNHYGFLYKKSLILHGPAGTGKTILVQRVANEFISQGSVVVFNPKPDTIDNMYEALAGQPETTLVIVLEEFDRLVARGEEELLTILDGENQRPNTIFLMTTNYIEKIPKRILRPSRVSNIVYVGFPELAARKSFLVSKGVSVNLANTIAESTEGFTIDELKEVIVGHIILENPLDLMLSRVREYKGVLESGETNEPENTDVDDYDDDF